MKAGKLSNDWYELGRGGETNLNSYFFRFESTNNEAVDSILAAVARAGKSYHHTSQWADDNDLGVSERDRIQLAAIVAAKTIDDLKDTIEKLESRLERIDFSENDLFKEVLEGRLRKFADKLNALYENNYSSYINQCGASGCRGEEAKLNNGTFSEDDLKDHKLASVYLGKYYAYHDAYQIISQLLTEL